MSTHQRSTEPRTRETMRLSWGLERPVRVAHTRNISSDGMFIEAAEPVASGSTLRISLQLAACTLPLRGRVAWTRTESDDCGPSGMGIALLRPPALYVHYVGRLREQAS